MAETLSERTGSYNPNAARARRQLTKVADNNKARLERMLGKRTSLGNKPLLKLTSKHRNIILLHLEGNSGVAIADTLDLSAIQVYRVLNDPLVKEMLAEFNAGMDRDMEGLYPLAVRAVRDGLTDGSNKTRLQAVDRFMKLTGKDKSKDREGSGDSAESVVKKALELAAESVRTVGGNMKPTVIIEQKPQIPIETRED